MQKPSFDTWTIIFLFAAIQGCFVSLVLLLKKDQHPSRKILATISLLFSVILIDYVLYWTHYEPIYPYLAGLPDCFIFLFGPLFYLYFKSIFNKTTFQKKDTWHFVTVVLCFIRISPFYFSSNAIKHDFLIHKIQLPQNYFLGLAWIGIAHMSLYAFFIMRDFYALSRSNPEVKTWFGWLSSFFMGFIFSYASYFILANFSFFNAEWDYVISFSMTFFIYFLAWFGYMQPKIFSGFSILEKEVIKYKNSPVSGDAGLEIVQKLQLHMQTNKLYIQSDISLDKLATTTGISKHYLSQAINENLKMNFFEYINTLRINEAKDLLLKPKEELNVIEVAYQVGYNNKVSFNKAFKTITGVTPTEFRQNHKKLVKL